MKINKEDMLDTDGWSWEDYSAIHEGKKVIVRVSIEIVRNWDYIEIKGAFPFEITLEESKDEDVN